MIFILSAPYINTYHCTLISFLCQSRGRVLRLLFLGSSIHRSKMKLIVTLAVVISASMAQRPMYAGSRPIGRPDLASRFRDPDDTSTIAVYNRIGDDGTTARIPVDARGDGQLVDRLNQWPREHRPFWLLNADQIEAARNPPRNQQNVQSRFGEETVTIRPTQQRSSFLSSTN